MRVTAPNLLSIVGQKAQGEDDTQACGECVVGGTAEYYTDQADKAQREE